MSDTVPANTDHPHTRDTQGETRFLSNGACVQLESLVEAHFEVQIPIEAFPDAENREQGPLWLALEKMNTPTGNAASCLDWNDHQAYGALSLMVERSRIDDLRRELPEVIAQLGGTTKEA